MPCIPFYLVIELTHTLSIIESYELPYLDFLRLIPSDMTCHLTKHAVRALSPHVITITFLRNRIDRKNVYSFLQTRFTFTASPLAWQGECTRIMACLHQSLTRRPSCGKLCSNVLAALVRFPEVANHTCYEYSYPQLYYTGSQSGSVMSCRCR